MTSPAPARSPTRSRSQASRRVRASIHSDCPSEVENHTYPNEDSSPGLGQRSVSLTTLQPTIIQPRMAQLETLEAKMASIEVSLSNTPRRKKLNNGILNSSIRSIPKEFAAKELENLRNALKDKENIIQSLRGHLTVPGLKLNSLLNGNHINNGNNGTTNNKRELTKVEKKQAEDRLARLKTDVENKRLAIKNLKMALERLDITDNIDVRIQQAELEYQLGREELNLLTLLEETRTLQLCLEESNRSSEDNNTLFSCINGTNFLILQGLVIEYDQKSPRFGASQKEDVPGLWIDWALDETGLLKGDRLIEVNGKMVLTKTREDLERLLASAPDPAKLVILRGITENGFDTPISTRAGSQEVAALRSELEIVKEQADEVQRVKEGLKSDNIRLTHRISYLEEQVAELLTRKSETDPRSLLSPVPVISKSNQNVTNINITSQNASFSTTNSSGEVQVFQKGPQVTALISNVPNMERDTLTMRSKSSLSNVSSTHIKSSSPQPDPNKIRKHKSPKHNGLKTSLKEGFEEIRDKVSYRKHHYGNKEKDYNSETNSNNELLPIRKTIEKRYSADLTKTNSEKDYRNSDVVDQSYRKATKIIQELTRTNKDSNLYEKHRQKCITASEKYNADILKHYNARKSTSVLDFRSEVHIYPKYCDARSVEEIDVPESGSKPMNKLFKKIQASRSVKSLDFDSDCNSISTRNGYKITDYNSELDNTRDHYLEHGQKQRPMPPKKPLRLSLHKTHSLQSVETSQNSSEMLNGKESRKRNYKGQIYPSADKNLDSREGNGYKEHVLWNCYRKNIDNTVEQGTWC
ncbi:hypothetical protein ABEB36_010182 [Hypothenemus hampei]|uniref:PDZ domain-containing protein n=1 Tax=Hypothenemus hampei TaxID=57062 RepID=A0ABD1EJ98_HYPHA